MPNGRRKQAWLHALGLSGLMGSLVVLGGCSGSLPETAATVPVKGRVVLASGKPLTAGRVTLVAKDGLLPPATGSLDAEGRFSLTTREPNDGAIPGEYKVRIEPGAPASRKPAFPLRYVDEDSSGLLVSVRAGQNELEPLRLR